MRELIADDAFDLPAPGSGHTAAASPASGCDLGARSRGGAARRGASRRDHHPARGGSGTRRRLSLRGVGVRGPSCATPPDCDVDRLGDPRHEGVLHRRRPGGSSARHRTRGRRFTRAPSTPSAGTSGCCSSTSMRVIPRGSSTPAAGAPRRSPRPTRRPSISTASRSTTHGWWVRPVGTSTDSGSGRARSHLRRVGPAAPWGSPITVAPPDADATSTSTRSPTSGSSTAPVGNWTSPSGLPVRRSTRHRTMPRWRSSRRPVPARVIERVVGLVVDQAMRAFGPRLLAHDEWAARRIAELQLYVRQHHGARDHAALGRLSLRSSGACPDHSRP